MKKIITLNLILCAFLISCTSNNNFSNKQRKFTTNNLSVEQIYLNVIKTTNPIRSMNKLPNSIKAELWQYKYNLFKKQHNLDSTQVLYLNMLSEFAYHAQVNQHYDKSEAKILNTYIIENFTPNQAMDLIYYIDTPSSRYIESNCFWCDIVVQKGPSNIRERPDGSHYLGRDGKVQRYRLGIKWGQPQDVDYIPCNWKDWVKDHS